MGIFKRRADAEPITPEIESTLCANGKQIDWLRKKVSKNLPTIRELVGTDDTIRMVTHGHYVDELVVFTDKFCVAVKKQKVYRGPFPWPEVEKVELNHHRRHDNYGVLICTRAFRLDYPKDDPIKYIVAMISVDAPTERDVQTIGALADQLAGLD